MYNLSVSQHIIILRNLAYHIYRRVDRNQKNYFLPNLNLEASLHSSNIELFAYTNVTWNKEKITPKYVAKKTLETTRTSPVA